MSTRLSLSLGGLALAVLLFLGVNLLAGLGLSGARIDLTAEKLYTLSPGTKSLLGNVKEPLTFRFVFSDKLTAGVPALKTYAQRVRDLLGEFARQSKGKIALEIVDPEPFSDDEDEAVKAGLQGASLDIASGRQVYFGLVAKNAAGRQEVIPFFETEKERFLEYDLARIVHGLAETRKPIVGLVGDMPLEFGPGGMMAAMRGQSRPYAVMEQLRQFFDIKTVRGDAQAIDDDVTVLIVAQPQTLSESMLYAIDQYVLKGGKALVFVDPLAEWATGSPEMGMMPLGIGLPPGVFTMLGAWGVGMEKGKFVADRELAVPVSTGDLPGMRRRVVAYPAWMTLTDAQRSKDDVVTARLGNLNMGTAGAFTKKEGAKITFAPLLTSSDQGQLLNVDAIGFRPDPEAVFAALKPGGERQVLAVRVSGTVATAFPDGPPKAKDEEKKDGEKKDEAKKDEAAKRPHLAGSTQPANLILVGDSDFLDDRFWVREQDFLGRRMLVPFAGNGDFVVNAVDNLTGSGELIGLRGRSSGQRPFEALDRLRRQAGERFLAEEQALQKRLTDTQRKLDELKGKEKPGTAQTLSDEEKQALDGFRAEMLKTRKELRAVQHNLNRDIERVGAWLKFLNIGLVPILVIGAALGLAYWRRKKAVA